MNSAMEKLYQLQAARLIAARLKAISVLVCILLGGGRMQKYLSAVCGCGFLGTYGELNK
jgi:hypothetical protein